MSRASGLYVRIEIKMGDENRTDTPALGMAIGDLKREGWSLEEYESGEDGREAYAILNRGWDISFRHGKDVLGEYAVETPSEMARI